MGGGVIVNGIIAQAGGSTTSVTTSRVDRLLRTDVIPFMRPIKISFTGAKLRPWAQVKPYFNGVDVSAFTVPNLGVAGGAIIADASGNVSGTFSVPPGTFRTGSSPFILSDDAEPANSQSYAATSFTAGGIAETRQATVTTTQVTNIVPVQPVQELGGGDGGDPLAQTFFIDTKTASPGCFVTKVSVYFKTKDTTQPIELELRESDNGYPGSTVLASKIVPSSNVLLSENSNTATDFVFDRPVYIKNKRQYAFVLKTNSTRYNAWVATMGESRVDKNEAVTKQPNAGVMFVSSNDSAWTPDQVSDVKFEISVANFSLTPGTIVSTNAFPSYKTSFDSSIQTYVGTKTVRIFALQHGLQVGSTTNVVITAPVGVTTFNGIPLAELQGIKTVTDIDAISFKFNVPTTNASLTSLVKTASVQFEPNVTADAIAVSTDATVLEGTDVAYAYKGISGITTDGGTQTPFVVDSSWIDVQNNAITSLDQPKMFVSFNETAARYAGLAQSKVKTVLRTYDTFVSPFIKTENSGVLAFTNFMSNTLSGEDYVAETVAGVGSLQCRYITQSVNLLNPATSLKVKFAANCVSGNYIDVYYRVLGTGASTAITDVAWTLFAPVKTFTNAPDRTTMYDYDYDLTGLKEYKSVQVKIVLRGTNSAIPPVVKDLRVLALAV